MPSVIPLLIMALIALSILVLVHEIGHFLVAKMVGIWPEEFGIGYPPRLFGKKFGETIYSINALPLGGFVRLHGEDPSEKAKYPERSFSHKPPLAKALVAVAGVFMNFIFAVVIFAALYAYGGGVAKGVLVSSVLPDSPADNAGLVEGDVIVSLGGQALILTESFLPEIDLNKGKTTTLIYEREKNGAINTYETNVTLPAQYSEERGLLGVGYLPESIVSPSWWQTPFTYLYYGFTKAVYLSEKIIEAFGGLLVSAFSGTKPEGLVGPVGAAGLGAEAARAGIVNLLHFTAIISINLAIINLVPFPPLDGSRLLIIAVEGLVGKKMLPRVESMVHTIGMIILLMLMLVLTAGEIPRLISAGSLSAFVDSLVQ